MNVRVKKIWWLVLLALLVAACGGSGDDDSSATLSSSVEAAVSEGDDSSGADDTSAAADDTPTTVAPTTAAPTTSAAVVPTSEAPTTTTEARTTTAPTVDNSSVDTSSGGAEAAGVVLAAVDAVEAAPSRAEMFLTMDLAFGPDRLELGSLDAPYGTMTAVGERAAVEMDLSVMVPEGTELPFDPNMDFVVDGTDMYLRAPMFAELGQLGGDPTFEPFAELGDGWGYVDTTLFEDLLPDDVAALLGQQSVGLDGYLDLVRGVTEASAGTPSTVRGIDTTNYRVSRTFAEWLEQTAGFDVDQFSALLGDADGLAPGELDAVFAAFEAIQVVLSVDVDAEGRMRRLDMDIDMGPMFEALGDEMGEEVPEDLEMSMLIRIDVVEYNPDLTVEIPTDIAADLTDAFRGLFGNQ